MEPPPLKVNNQYALGVIDCQFIITKAALRVVSSNIPHSEAIAIAKILEALNEELKGLIYAKP